MGADRPRLTNLSEIYRYLRRNETPIYVVTPMPFSLLGLDQWVGSLEFVNYFDVFEGQHPRCFVPATAQAPEFKSMEDVANYLIDHAEFRAAVKRRPRGLALFVMFDEETEQLCEEVGVDIALPPYALRTRLDSKIETTRLGNEAGVASAPNTMGRAGSYAELTALAEGAGLGSDLVVQTPYGDSGRTTFFIRSEAD